ncbi:MAG: GGDEF domain-containing protein, partial [Actinomycetota bacterium]
HAALAIEKAGGPDAEQWRQDANLLAGCAAADGPDPVAAADAIERYAAALDERGQRLEVAFARPFLAIALGRSGEYERALEVIEQAYTDLPSDAGWLTTAAVNHTRAVLLARGGDRAATSSLIYGDTLAEALWRQRLGTLHTATTLRSYSQLRKEHARVARTAETDAVTDVPNRRAFDRVLDSMKGSGDNRAVAVLVVDLDNFKAVNDAQGHAAGDDVLRAVAAALVREIRDGDLVARLGGDEFGVLLPGASGEVAEVVARRMVDAVNALVECLITVSIGAASGATSAALATWHDADLAMYVAKRAGGNQAHLHELES